MTVAVAVHGSDAALVYCTSLEVEPDTSTSHITVEETQQGGPTTETEPPYTNRVVAVSVVGKAVA